jgi:hypothetical protein
LNSPTAFGFSIERLEVVPSLPVLDPRSVARGALPPWWEQLR